MENEIELKVHRIEKLIIELGWILDKIKNEIQREEQVDIETLNLYKHFLEAHKALMEEIETILDKVFSKELLDYKGKVEKSRYPPNSAPQSQSNTAL